MIDLHTHSTASDGTYTPNELVDYAVSKGLTAIALTDHDTTDGLMEAFSRARYYQNQGIDIEVIPGIEFSTDYFGKDIHIVGLYVDFEGEFLKKRLSYFKSSRTKRNLEMCEKLTSLGMPIDYDELCATYPDGVITRAHYAKFMLKKGYVKSTKEAFERYIGDGMIAHVRRKNISPMRAVEIIRRAGGIPVLAHPVLYGMSKDRLENLVKRLKGAGLLGIEAIYSTYTPSDERDIRALAAKYDLVISGGSDFHGTNKPDIDLGVGRGRLYIDESVLVNITQIRLQLPALNANYQLTKLLLTDLDGTLLKDDKTISSYTYDILSRWCNSGHYLALCSGRDIASVNRVLDELKLSSLPNTYTIGFNGGLIHNPHDDSDIHRVALKVEDAAYLYNEAKKAGIYFQTYDDDHFVVPYASEETMYYTRVIKTPYVVDEELFPSLTKAPCKCLMIELHDLKKIDAFVQRMTPWANEHNITLLYSNPNYVEVIPSTSGKGKCFEILTNYLDIPGLMAVGAGDEQNDISLLEAADIAIAMKNGIDAIKNVSSIVTDFSSDEDGLAHVLEGIL